MSKRKQQQKQENQAENVNRSITATQLIAAARKRLSGGALDAAIAEIKRLHGEPV